jgi:hypothetical protein
MLLYKTFSSRWFVDHSVDVAGAAVHVDTVIYGAIVVAGGEPSIVSAFTKTGTACPVLKLNVR